MQPTSIIMLFCIWIILYMLYLGIQFGRLHDEVREFRKEQKKPELIIQNNAPMRHRDLALMKERLVKEYYPPPPMKFNINKIDNDPCEYCQRSKHDLSVCRYCKTSIMIMHSSIDCGWVHSATGIITCDARPWEPGSSQKLAEPDD